MTKEKIKRIEGTKNSPWMYASFILAAFLIVGAYAFFSLNSASLPSAGNSSLAIGNSPMIGNKDAKVTIYEFTDFSCPFCGAASGDSAQYVQYMKSQDASWEPPVPGIIRDYVNTGKVKLVVKYTYGHTGGHPAQLVAWCINEQGLFDKFYNQAFANQDKVEDLDSMKTLAQNLGADMTKLNSCLSSGRYSGQFDAEQRQADAAGVQGTPTFFVDGKAVRGAQSYATFKQVIDAALA